MLLMICPTRGSFCTWVAPAARRRHHLCGKHAERNGSPDYLRAFVDETRLTGLRFNFDIGHAHLAEFPEEQRLEKSFSPLRELVSSVHLHDNHGEKDEHLPPYDGSIHWPDAIKLLKSAAQNGGLPLVLELKQKIGHDAATVSEQLSSARKSLDRFEKAWA